MTSVRYDSGAPAIDQYVSLFETTGWNRMYRCSPEQLARALAGSWHVVSAYRADVLIGVGRVVSDGVLYAVIFDLIVAPAEQGHGIGSKILSKLLDRCNATGIRDVLLFAATDTAPFYRRFGFIERPSRAPGMLLRSVRE